MRRKAPGACSVVKLGGFDAAVSEAGDGAEREGVGAMDEGEGDVERKGAGMTAGDVGGAGRGIGGGTNTRPPGVSIAGP